MLMRPLKQKETNSSRDEADLLFYKGSPLAIPWFCVDGCSCTARHD